MLPAPICRSRLSSCLQDNLQLFRRLFGGVWSFHQLGARHVGRRGGELAIQLSVSADLFIRWRHHWLEVKPSFRTSLSCNSVSFLGMSRTLLLVVKCGGKRRWLIFVEPLLFWLAQPGLVMLHLWDRYVFFSRFMNHPFQWHSNSR